MSQTTQIKEVTAQLLTFAEINFFFSFFFLLSNKAMRGLYEFYQSWTAIEQESYSFASPLEAQAQKTYYDIE